MRMSLSSYSAITIDEIDWGGGDLVNLNACKPIEGKKGKKKMGFGLCATRTSANIIVLFHFLSLHENIIMSSNDSLSDA